MQPISTEGDTLERALKQFASHYTTSHKRRKINGEWIVTHYLDLPVSYDIEVTSWGEGDDRVGIPYTAQICVNGLCVLCRTIEESKEVLERLRRFYDCNNDRRLCVFIHNAGYEFGFLQTFFDWREVFALDAHQPLFMIDESGLEFRCSYKLSGIKLESVGEHLLKYKVHKLVGDLDYSKPRSPDTPLTDAEVQYCLNDVRVVAAYIQEEIERYGGIAQLPLTNTGRVRKYCRDECLYHGKNHKDADAGAQREKYTQTMRNLRLRPLEYEMLHQGFQGGFTHANCIRSTVLLRKVTSFDFCSSYPAVMVAEKYPMGRGTYCKITSAKQAKEMMENYCCLFEVEFERLEIKQNVGDRPISISRCDSETLKNSKSDNGRLIVGDHVRMVITEQDWYIIRDFYNCIGKIKFGKFLRYARGYLPTEFVKCILKLYKDKTELKGIPESADDYQRSKGMLNSLYGMCVTNIIRDEHEYDAELLKWTTNEPDLDEALERYNRNMTRFNSYAWGVWVTAYARKNLFSGILACGNDYCYSDTDSLKITNAEAHMDYIREFNARVMEKLQAACDYHKIDFSEVAPKTIKGKQKPLGIWEHDGEYELFKTQGAKRYLTFDGKKLSMTVAGCGYHGAEYLLKTAGVPYHEDKEKKEWIVDDATNIERVFDLFTDGMVIPEKYSGRLLHTYIDEKREGVMVDYMGNPYSYSVPSSIHLSSIPYTMTMSTDYKLLTDSNINYLEVF